MRDGIEVCVTEVKCACWELKCACWNWSVRVGIEVCVLELKPSHESLFKRYLIL